MSELKKKTNKLFFFFLFFKACLELKSSLPRTWFPLSSLSISIAETHESRCMCLSATGGTGLSFKSFWILFKSFQQKAFPSCRLKNSLQSRLINNFPRCRLHSLIIIIICCSEFLCPSIIIRLICGIFLYINQSIQQFKENLISSLPKSLAFSLERRSPRQIMPFMRDCTTLD